MSIAPHDLSIIWTRGLDAGDSAVVSWLCSWEVTTSYIQACWLHRKVMDPVFPESSISLDPLLTEELAGEL